MQRPSIYVNTRSLSAPLTGVQRYTREVLARLGAEVGTIEPPAAARGLTGHLWEQLVLPRRLGGALLWSPANTGPVTVARQVITIHDIAPIDHPEWMSRRFARWYAYMMPRAARRAMRVITDSEFTRGRVIERLGVPEERVVVVPIGVDARFRPGAAETRWRAGDPHAAFEPTGATGDGALGGRGGARHVEALAGLPAGRYVLFLGSLEPRKNLRRLLDAWRRALPALPADVSLVVAGGEGGRRVFADSSIGALPDRVAATGRVPEDALPALHAGALAFVYPSIYEGFGLPPLEAMASGVPVVAGNRTSLPEVLGDAALLVDPLEVDAIADALVRIATDEPLRDRLRARGLERARGFTWDRTAAAVRSVLEEAAGG